MLPMLILLAICTLALLLYMFFYMRTEIFRLNERQNTTLMHIARMNRSMTTTILQAMHPEEVDGEQDVGQDGQDGEVASEDAVEPAEESTLTPVVEEVDDSEKS